MLNQVTGIKASEFDDLDMDDYASKVRDSGHERLKKVLSVMSAVRNCLDQSDYSFSNEEVKEFKRLKKVMDDPTTFHMLSNTEVSAMKAGTDSGKAVTAKYGFNGSPREWNEELALHELSGLQVVLQYEVEIVLYGVERVLTAIGMGSQIPEALAPLNNTIDKYSSERNYISDTINYSKSRPTIRAVKRSESTKKRDKSVSFLGKVSLKRNESKMEKLIGSSEGYKEYLQELDNIGKNYGDAGKALRNEMMEAILGSSGSKDEIRARGGVDPIVELLSSGKFDNAKADAAVRMLNDNMFEDIGPVSKAMLINASERFDNITSVRDDVYNGIIQERDRSIDISGHPLGMNETEEAVISRMELRGSSVNTTDKDEGVVEEKEENLEIEKTENEPDGKHNELSEHESEKDLGSDVEQC
jgi:hypothetical protein